MNYSYILRPLIGAFTGYITNWIAVKMMFRPTKPIFIGKLKLPFTPGLIPKNQEKIAISIGDTISESLLNEDTLKEVLLSGQFKSKIMSKIDFILNSDTSIQELITSKIDNDSFDRTLENIKSYLSKSIYNSILESNFSELVANELEKVASEKLQSSILGIFGGKTIISSIKSTAYESIDSYIKTNGENIVYGLVEKEINKLANKSIKDLSANINLNKIIFNIYENYIIEKIPEILDTINISKIVSDKISSMDVLELEKLLLNIMKKELNALVNLGALIGFILGLLNLVI